MAAFGSDDFGIGKIEFSGFDVRLSGPDLRLGLFKRALGGDRLLARFLDPGKFGRGFFLG